MASVEESLFTRLTTHAGLSALIAARCYEDELPQEPVLPAITYMRVSTRRNQTHEAPSHLAAPRFQVDGWAATIDSRRLLAAQMRAALDGYVNKAGTPRIDAILLDNEFTENEAEVGRYRVVMDVFIWHGE